MCRICGRVVRCIFDTMPSRTLSRPSTSTIASTTRSSTRHLSTRTATLKAQMLNDTRPSCFGRSIPPTFQIPFRSRLHTTTTQRATVESSIPSTSRVEDLPPSFLSAHEPATLDSQAVTIDVPAAQEAEGRQPLVLSKSLQNLLPALRAQQPHYITCHIHRFPYLLTEGDTLRLPFEMHGVSPGDVLRFNRASIIGSRDYTMKAGTSSPQHTSPVHVRGEPFENKRRTNEPSYIDERLFECRMRVMGLDSGPMVIKEKTKRRNRRTRRVTSKHKYTVLKVMEVNIKSLDELTSLQNEQVLLE